VKFTGYFALVVAPTGDIIPLPVCLAWPNGGGMTLICWAWRAFNPKAGQNVMCG